MAFREWKRTPRPRAAHSWVVLVGLTVFAAIVASGNSLAATASGVPPELQAELLGKLTAYDRNFTHRAGSTALILIAVRKGDPRSEVAAASIKSALARIDRVGGLPHRESLAEYETAAALAARCREERVAVLYLAPGLDDHVGELRSALAGVAVLSVSAVPDLVPQGVVLGFELVSGKPKIMLNLPQAKKQYVDFEAGVLKLMKVYR